MMRVRENAPESSKTPQLIVFCIDRWADLGCKEARDSLSIFQSCADWLNTKGSRHRYSRSGRAGVAVIQRGQRSPANEDEK